MRETFPTKKRGDSLAAAHVNALSNVARRVAAGAPGSYGVTREAAGVRAGVRYPPWVQGIVIVTSDLGLGLYEVQPRYYDHRNLQWATDGDAGPWEMDASDLELAFNVGHKTVAYWDEQRRMFVPILAGLIPLVDVWMQETQIGYTESDPTPTIWFCLEAYNRGAWGSTNNRIYCVNCSNMLDSNGYPTSDPAEVSGTGIYTFRIAPPSNHIYLRVRALCGAGFPVWLDFGALRIEAMLGGSVTPSHGAQINPVSATSLTPGGYEAKTDDLTDPVIRPYAGIEGGLIRVDIPAGQTWTFKAELSCKFTNLETSESSTSPSSSSTSSQSRSSSSS